MTPKQIWADQGAWQNDFRYKKNSIESSQYLKQIGILFTSLFLIL
jgi:hypothetical protein